jgi:hypothetical protein
MRLVSYSELGISIGIQDERNVCQMRQNSKRGCISSASTIQFTFCLLLPVFLFARTFAVGSVEELEVSADDEKLLTVSPETAGASDPDGDDSGIGTMV